MGFPMVRQNKLLKSILFFLLFTFFLQGKTLLAAPGDPCPNGDAECDLCGGEICYQGVCTFWGTDPCRLDCATCQQSDDTTICIPQNDFCQNLAGTCRSGSCDGSADYINNPSGCDFLFNPEPTICKNCQSCGNGICEPPENPSPSDENNPNGCPEDCLQPGVDPSLPANPITSCGPIDDAQFSTLNCNDGNLCTEDICNVSPFGLVGPCSYEPKGCSGATSDFCCPRSCSGDPSSGGNFDVDCCVPPPSPNPTPTPTPNPKITPNPSEPGPNSDTGDNFSGGLRMQGSGCNSLLAGAPSGDRLSWLFLILGFAFITKMAFRG